MRTPSFALALALCFLVACDDDNDSSAPVADAQVSMQDNCEPSSFNAALGAGTCAGSGTMTLSQFNAELNANHSVAAWRFVPPTLTVRKGQRIAAKNDGGEVHTFTEVESFGGGIVAALNSASGNTTVAPECQNLPASAMVARGATFRTDEEDTPGTEKYQCCIHPWMRAVVTVTP